MRPSLLAFALGLLALAGAASAQPVTLPGTQPRQLTAPLQASAQCTECHGGQATPDGTNYLPNDTWQTSMMANATVDPLFQATAAVANQQTPGLGQFCLRCHSPSGFTAGRAQGGTLAGLSAVDGDTDGVHCDVCHRSLDPALQPMPAPIGDARIFYQDAPAGTLPARHGPYTDPFMSPRHPSVGDGFVRDARLCGQCHDLDNPLVHRRSLDGHDTGQPFPLQSTFSEWQQSAFGRGTATVAPGRTCQECHMPAQPGTLPVTRIPNAPLRPDPRRHDFFGGNEWGIALVHAAVGDTDVPFDDARMRARSFLQASAAQLAITASPPTARAGSTARITVRVTNRTGHKLPTGYEDARLMWLQVAAGTTVVSGVYRDDALVEDTAADPQLRVYRFQAGLADAMGHPAHSDFVARHEFVLEDTRIPPEGLMPTDRTAPVGRDYSGGPNGALRHWDETSFDVPIPAGTPNGPLALSVRLMYQATTKRYVNAIAAENHTDAAGSRLLTLWNTAGRAPPFAVATQTVMVNVTGGAPASDGGTDGGAGRDASGDASGDAASDAAGDASGDAGSGVGGAGGAGTGGCTCSPARPHGTTGALLGLLAVALASQTRRRRHG